MKRVLILVMVIVCILGMSSCGRKDSVDTVYTKIVKAGCTKRGISMSVALETAKPEEVNKIETV